MKLKIFLLLCFFYSGSNLFAQKSSNTKKIDSLTSIIDNCNNCGSDHLARAKLYIEEDKKMEAMYDLNRTIEIHIENFSIDNSMENIRLNEYYNERAYLKGSLKDYRGAIQDFEKSISTKAGYATLWDEVFYGKGFCETQIDKYADAIDSYEKALIHNPNNESTYYNLGLIKIELGKKDEGCLNLSKAGELGKSEAYKIISKYCN